MWNARHEWGTYDEIAKENLQDLGLQACAAGKYLLEDAHEEVAQWGSDKHAVEKHFRNTGAEVVPIPADIIRDPRGQVFLSCGKHTRRQHLGAQRVLLQLTQVHL